MTITFPADKYLWFLTIAPQFSSQRFGWVHTASCRQPIGDSGQSSQGSAGPHWAGSLGRPLVGFWCGLSPTRAGIAPIWSLCGWCHGQCYHSHYGWTTMDHSHSILLMWTGCHLPSIPSKEKGKSQYHTNKKISKEDKIYFTHYWFVECSQMYKMLCIFTAYTVI